MAYIRPCEIQAAYEESGSIAGAAKILGVTYPTAHKWITELGFKKKRQGYTAPELPITGLQCRHAREYLGMSRDDFCERAGVSKTSLREFELGKALMRESTLKKVLKVFEEYRISFQGDGTFREGVSPPPSPGK